MSWIYYSAFGTSFQTKSNCVIWIQSSLGIQMLQTTLTITAQKVKFSIHSFSSNCDQIRRKLQLGSHLLEKSLMENFIFCAVNFLRSTKNMDKSKEDNSGFDG